jgi:serine/threonine protein kinase
MGALIGTGATGRVYQGTWNRQYVAVKKFVIADTSAEAKPTLDSMQKECEILGSLNHPQIVKLFAFASDAKNNEFCLVMEYCAKGSLGQYVYVPGHWEISPNWTVDVLTQVSDGLAFLHRKNTLHLDLKPENILLRENGSVALCDFGLSYTLKAEQTHKTTVSISGTPAFIDPVLIKPVNRTEKAKKIAANDIYSFAMVAWCCLMRRSPYEGWDLYQIMFHVASGDREDLPDTTKPIKLAALVKQCWVQNQEHRPTAAEVSASMHAIHKEEVGNNVITFPTKK